MTNVVHHSLDSLFGQSNETRVSSTKVGGKGLTEEIGYSKLEGKVGKARSCLSGKETGWLGLVMFVRARSVNVKELGKEGRDDKKGSVVCEKWLQEVGPICQKVQAREPSLSVLYVK